jgi:hypothetical protein
MTKECLLAEKSSETGPQKMRVLGRRAEFVFLCIFKGWVRDLLP